MNRFIMTSLCMVNLLLSVELFGTFLYGQENKSKKINQTDLIKMLDTIGITSKKINGQTVQIQWRGKDLDFVIQGSFIENEDYLYLEAFLRTIDNPTMVAANTWRKILAMNDQIGRCAFIFDETKNRLYLNLKVRNHNLTETKLRSELNLLDEKVHFTRHLWYKDNLKYEEKSVSLFTSGPFGATALSKGKNFSLEGKWIMISGIEKGIEQKYATEKPFVVTYKFSKDQMIAEQNGKEILTQKYKVDSKDHPTTIDSFDDKGNIKRSLVQIVDSDEFSICSPPSNTPTIRPKEFLSTFENNQLILRFQRAK